MNPQQLQTARAALWHQNASPLVTYDDAAPWLDEMGLCLFLPRHTQLPAPAPSFVEACMGEMSITPPAPAIAGAMELAIRLVDARRAIPLNLLGAFSEQPDYLITPEVLPWVAAIRGDRNWKAAPAGRTSPLVVRVWEALEKLGGQTAIELRELLGREVTEAAVLRALIELWGLLRALPTYTAGEPTRWNLLKDQYSAELTTGANASQATALSALLSIYIRSAVAASGEEAEVFLSPLTARSRIREVVHGMTASRSFGTMSVGAQTLLFVEGTLPEGAAEAPAEEAPAAPDRPRAAFRKEQGRQERSERRPERFTGRTERRGAGPERDRPRRDERGGEPLRGAERPRGGERPRGERPGSDQRREGGREERPAGGFRKRPAFGQKREWKPREERGPSGFAARRGTGGTTDGGKERPRGEQSRGERPGSNRFGPRGGSAARRPGFGRGASGPAEGRPKTWGQAKPWGKAKPRPWEKPADASGEEGAEKRPFRRETREEDARGDRGREERPRPEFRGRREQGAFRPQREGRPGAKSPGARGFGAQGAGARGAGVRGTGAEKRSWRPERPRPEGRPGSEARPHGEERRPARPDFRREGQRPAGRRPEGPAGEESTRPFRRGGAAGPAKRFPGKPGFAGAGRPSTGRPGTGRPSAGRPASGRSGFGKTPSGKPGFGKAGFGKSGFSKAGSGKAGAGGTGRPARGGADRQAPPGRRFGGRSAGPGFRRTRPAPGQGNPGKKREQNRKDENSE